MSDVLIVGVLAIISMVAMFIAFCRVMQNMLNSYIENQNNIKKK